MQNYLSIVRFLTFPSGESFSLGDGDGRWTIGSSPTADLQLPEGSGAQISVVLQRRFGVLTLSVSTGADVRVDGNRVTICELHAGSRLQIGSVALTAKSHAPQATVLIGNSPAFVSATSRASRAAKTECSVLILGETGTGKEVFANAVHRESNRKNGPFVAINCGAIPRELLAAELFGHEKGAFTGANTQREGVFEQAQGGTLFLDEIAELPLDQQAHLLRVLETKRIRRIGGSREIPVDVRIVAATHKAHKLGEEDGALRVDLYHRIATVVIEIPPLRKRGADIELLINAAFAEFEAVGISKRPSFAALMALCEYRWPGNVRELRQAVARAIALGGEVLELHDFLPNHYEHATTASEPGPQLAPYEDVLRQAMGRALDRKRTIRAAAKELGMPKSTFFQRAKYFGLVTHRRRA